MKYLFIFVAVFSILLSSASAFPSLPSDCEDSTFDGKVEEFFQKRFDNSTCRQNLNNERQSYEGQALALRKLVEKLAMLPQKSSSDARTLADAIDKLQDKLTEQRKKYLAVMEECGECLTTEVIPEPNNKESWFISNGSCYIPSKTPEEARKHFLARAQSLLTVKDYPQRWGGFSHVLSFIGVSDQGFPEEPSDFPSIRVPHSHAFIAVKSPFNMGFPIALAYHFTNTTEGISPSDDEFRIRFESRAEPEDFYEGEIYEQRANGRKVKYRKIMLPKAKGMWCLKSNGYMRYFTAADFAISLPVKVSFFEREARRILLDTMVQLWERVPGKGNTF